VTLVSVIIPVYNSEKHIENCIKSVLEQTYSPLEIILVDDCSTDSSQKILKTYSKLPNIKLILLDNNKGQANALNIGILNSKGPVISFLDSDDLFLPDHIQKSVKGLLENKVGLVYSEVQHINEKGLNIVKNHKLKIKSENMNDKVYGLLLFNYIIRSSLTVSRESLREVGLFDNKISGSDDIDLCLRILIHSEAYKIKETTVIKNLHSSNISETRVNKKTYYYRCRLRTYLKLYHKTSDNLLLNLFHINRYRLNSLVIFCSRSKFLAKIINRFFDNLIILLLSVYGIKSNV